MHRHSNKLFPLPLHLLVALLLLAALLCLPMLVRAQAQSPLHSDDDSDGSGHLEQVKGNVYRFVYEDYRTLVVVGAREILLVDTHNHAAATRLRELIAQRFHKPVRYVVYSHNHSDHIYGAEVFRQPGTVFVAQALAKQDIVTTRAATVVPDVTFEQAMDIDLEADDGGDGKTEHVELRYHGINDGRGSISVRVLPEKVVFVVDWIVLGRMPWQKLWSYDIQGVINSTRAVQQLDYDIFVGGHGAMGSKADVARYLRYMETLYAKVIDGIHAGKSMEELQKVIRLDDYKDLPHYADWLPLNVEGVYKRLMAESGMGWRPDLP